MQQEEKILYILAEYYPPTAKKIYKGHHATTKFSKNIPLEAPVKQFWNQVRNFYKSSQAYLSGWTKKIRMIFDILTYYMN